ncbi:AAA family ATPase [Deltaproteobacteria bacterium TL4]
MTIIAVINQKGGVGKTTVTANLAAAIAERDYATLVIDLDPQGNLTAHFGFNPEQLEWTLYNALLKRPTKEFQKPNPLEFVIHETNLPKLQVIPSNLELSSAELEMAGMMGRESLLSEILEPIDKDYDFIFIDCPPSLGLLSLNALAAANEVLIPYQTEYFALKGISQLLEVTNLVKKRKINPKLEIGGFIGSLYDGRKKLHCEVVESMQARFGSQCFETLIHSTVSLAESPSHGKTIFDYAPRSRGAQDYHALGLEFLKRRNLAP